MKPNLLNSVKLTKPNKNSFDLSHDVKMSLEMGTLYPTLALECVPGDKISISNESLLRFAPLVSPVMHRMNVYMHYFFVPNRILWPNWEKYITNTKLETTGQLPAHPVIPYNAGLYSPLLDYMGLPPITGGNLAYVNALPFAAYSKICDEYYRDQNLMPSTWEALIDGNNAGKDHLYNIQQRCWEHDYFTAALPFAQKGDPVSIPLGTFPDVPVYRNAAPLPSASTTLTGDPEDQEIDYKTTDTDLPLDRLYAETSTLEGTETTINDLRVAFRLQEWLEKAARGGSRYVENILSFFGVRSSDKRLQRPEYITGSKSPVVISEVLNTAGGETPQGNMAGHGIAVSSGRNGSYFCEEHGYIIGIMSVLPLTAYQQGIPKHFLKVNDPFEYFWPQFAHIGEQEIENQEVYVDSTVPTETFGYIPRYAEYKFMNSRVAGEFRNSLDFWHMGRIFETQPALNDAFVQADPTTRIFAVEEGANHLYAHILHKIRANRPMPKFGTPSF